MKIAIINQPIGRQINLPWDGRGSSINIWIYEAAHRLAKNCEIIVYTKKDLWDLIRTRSKKVEYDRGVKYRRIYTFLDSWFTLLSKTVEKIKRFPGLRMLRYILFFRNIKRPLFASSLYYFTYALQVAKDLKKEKCDIAHIINFSQFVPIIRAFNPEIKIILHMRCDWLTQLDSEMVKKRLKKVDLVLGNSEYITNKIRLFFPEFANRCQTVYNAVDIDYFSSNKRYYVKKNDVKRLLYVGRISPEKGLHVLLDAFKKVIEIYPKTQLYLVGPSNIPPIEFIVPFSNDPKVFNLASYYKINYLSYLHDKLSADVANQVSFTGEVPHIELIDFYRDADIFIFPSVWEEPFGIPIIEAMATGVPVIATRVGGIPEIIEDGKTGILVEPNDATELAEAIIKLLSDEELRKSLRNAARKRAIEIFSWDQIVKKLLYHYKNIYEDFK